MKHYDQFIELLKDISKKKNLISIADTKEINNAVKNLGNPYMNVEVPSIYLSVRFWKVPIGGYMLYERAGSRILIIAK